MAAIQPGIEAIMSSSNSSQNIAKDVSDEDRVMFLQKGTKDMPLKLSEKKKLLFPLIISRHDIIRQASLFDDEHSTSLSTALQNLIPLSKTQVKIASFLQFFIGNCRNLWLIFFHFQRSQFVLCCLLKFHFPLNKI